MAKWIVSPEAYLGMARREIKQVSGAIDEIEELLHEDPPDGETVLFLLDHVLGRISQVRSWTDNYEDGRTKKDPNDKL